MTVPALTVRDVTVREGARTLLSGVCFEASAREIVAVIGPNGAGKTTLLEVVAGVRAADHGTVASLGAPLATFAERAQRIAFLPDAGELPSELRVADVVRHVLHFSARPAPLVAALRRDLDVDALVETPAGVLSRGERQRVALFCALAVDRPIVVLDEPFSAFDPLKLRDVFSAVRRVAQAGAAVVTTIHHLGDAAKIADRVLILAEGRVVAWGTLESLRSTAGSPDGDIEDLFVALLTGRPHAS